MFGRGGRFEEIKSQSAPRVEVLGVTEGFYWHMVVIEDGSNRQTKSQLLELDYTSKKGIYHSMRPTILEAC